MKPKSLPSSRSLPPRRLLAIAAAAALFSNQGAHASSQTKHPKATLNGSEVVCPLGDFLCPPRPDNFALCKPNGMLEFYDPFLSKDSALRASATTQVWADHVESPDQITYHLNGHVKTVRADQELHADFADYNSDSTDYDARGNVSYQEATHLLSADHITGNTGDSTGLATGNVRYQLLDSHGNGTAVRAQMLDADRNRYTMATYSTCDVGGHIWELRAREIDTDDTSGRGVAHSATMSMYGVPFFYFPWMSFPLNNDRQSGFLYPYFEHTGRAGYQFRIPYYFNLAPNYDATLTPRYYSLRGAMLSGEVRYMFPRSSGEFQLEFLPHDNYNDQKLTSDSIDTQGRQRYLYRFVNNTSLWPGWSLSTNINRASDQNYLRDFGDDLFSISTALLTSSVYLYGGGSWWSASLGGDVWQNVDPSQPNSVEPYKRLPRATFNMDIPFARWYDVGLTSEAVKFHKFDQVEGSRVDLYPYVDADFRGAAWFIRPKLAYRYTGYSLDSGYQRYSYYGALPIPSDPNAAKPVSPFTQSNPSRSLPIISLDQGLIFERSTNLFDTHYTQTLEPRLYYLYVPYRNQNNLPLFDTSPMAFDDWMLFAPNQYSGADRQMNANNLTAAVTTRLLDDGGVERLSATFGQIHYFTPQRIEPLLCETIGATAATCNAAKPWTGSDYVAELSTQLNDQWTASTEYLWNPNTRLTDLGTFTLQRRLGFDGVLNFSYRFRRGLLEQYQASTVYPLTERWRLIGEWTYSMRDKRTVEALAGVQYEGCCVKVALVARHYVTGYYGVISALPPGQKPPGSDTAVMFQLEFKGLGAFSGQTESVLRRDILGYQ
ncbi:LPS-assembly protein LptD [Dyella flagellata]|uniref:LPS-assembly protein LptD n=1 Tax=Dyella flagellata TaxID=1867833 RepID=A0ABQ5XK25_9GAMM|nr:LPS assembly protein LptD [Dyella flagellata]GLQ90855.1 LPS-assembly protein LptD [Dyella flagellata]